MQSAEFRPFTLPNGTQGITLFLHQMENPVISDPSKANFTPEEQRDLESRCDGKTSAEEAQIIMAVVAQKTAPISDTTVIVTVGNTTVSVNVGGGHSVSAPPQIYSTPAQQALPEAAYSLRRSARERRPPDRHKPS